MPSKLINDAQFFWWMQSKVRVRTENLSEDKGSIKLYNKDDNNEGGTSDEEDDHSAGKSPHMPMLTGKMRAVTTKDINEEDSMRERDSAKGRKKVRYLKATGEG
jgi:hypothetical protein